MFFFVDCCLLVVALLGVRCVSIVFAAGCLIGVTCCVWCLLLFVVCRLFGVLICCVLFVVARVLFVVRCVLCVVWCLLFSCVGCCSL